MINDPYKILGISQNATNDEIKKAYRQLSKKYHPDSHHNNPLSELAEEKFKEVQEAYEQVMKDRENGGTGASYSRPGNSGSGQSYGGGNEAPEMNSVYSYLNANRFREALNVLNGINNRTARWYYCSAIANAGIGNNIQAHNHAQTALNMEPNNPDYINLYNRMQWQNQRYQNTSYGGGRSTLGTGNLCCDLWCADSLCECMGGDLCSCL